MIVTLTPTQRDALTALHGGELELLEETGMTPEELKQAALDAGIERCRCCHWWYESADLCPEGYCGFCGPRNRR